LKSLVAVFIFVLLAVSQLQAQMYDPFQKTAVMKKTHATSLLLMPLPALLSAQMPMPTPTVVTAVMNEKAFINGVWYKVGDKVNDQEITSIQANFVTLKEGNRLTMLGVGNQQRLLGTKDTQ
jgi:hypothetical protein